MLLSEIEMVVLSSGADGVGVLGVECPLTFFNNANSGPRSLWI